MRRALPVLAILAALAACAAEQPAEQAAPAAPVAAAPPSEIVVTVTRTGAPAREMMHLLAAQCWLDGIVGGAQLIVKPDGNLVIVGETSNLVAAEYVGLRGAASRWRLTGDRLAEPETTRLLLRSIDHANATGETRCEGATG